MKVLFFAQTRELVGMDSVELEGTFDSVEAVRAHLVATYNDANGKWDLALDPSKLLAAVDQSIVPLDHPVTEGNEIAFFPPVTGG